MKAVTCFFKLNTSFACGIECLDGFLPNTIEVTRTRGNLRAISHDSMYEDTRYTFSVSSVQRGEPKRPRHMRHFLVQAASFIVACFALPRILIASYGAYVLLSFSRVHHGG